MTRIIVAGGRSVATAAFAFALLPAALGAQGNASSAASGMGGNYTAVARNFNAVAWNPANLGLAGNSRFSLAIVSPQLGLGTGPVTLADLNEYGGEVVPVAVRNQWLQKIIDNDGQDLGGELDVTPLAVSVGRIGLSATTSVRTNGAMPAGVAELLFFGNAGRTGSPQDHAFSDLAFDGNATTTVAAAFGQRIARVPFLGQFSVGVTGKYIIGHGMASMRDNGSTLTSDPVEVNLDAPMVLTDTSTANNGRGFGLDLGAAWVVGDFKVGANLMNVINTFQWDTDRLYYLPVRATFDADDSDADIDEILPLSAAPADLREELRARIDQTTPQPTLALGGAYTGFSRLTLAADIRQRFGDGLDLGAKTHVGVGAELRLIPAVPLRAGVTSLTGGMRYSGGIGLEFGVFNLQLSASMMQADGRSDTGGGFTVSFGGR
jgi:hypothetical protein